MRFQQHFCYDDSSLDPRSGARGWFCVSVRAWATSALCSTCMGISSATPLGNYLGWLSIHRLVYDARLQFSLDFRLDKVTQIHQRTTSLTPHDPYGVVNYSNIAFGVSPRE